MDCVHLNAELDAARFRVLHMSDAPVITPLVPLAAFAPKLGEPPPQASLQVYLHRMREHGFDVSPTLAKALRCGAAIHQEVRPGLCPAICTYSVLN